MTEQIDIIDVQDITGQSSSCLESVQALFKAMKRMSDNKEIQSLADAGLVYVDWTLDLVREFRNCLNESVDKRGAA